MLACCLIISHHFVVNHLGETDAQLLGVCRIVRHVEVLHEDLAEDEMVRLAVALSNDAQMARVCLRVEIEVSEEEAR